MASIFRRIYDWLLRLFWCVFPLPPSDICPALPCSHPIPSHLSPLGMRRLLHLHLVIPQKKQPPLSAASAGADASNSIGPQQYA